MRYLLLFSVLVLLHSVNAKQINNKMLSTDSEFTSLTDKDANDRYHEQFIEFKNNQNNLADSERVKILFQNQYWLVNKNQDLWVGFF